MLERGVCARERACENERERVRMREKKREIN